MNQQEEKKLLQDIRRSLILSVYIRHWEFPDQRTSSRRGDDVIEVYSFPSQSNEKVRRFATVGISSINRQEGNPIPHELFMCLPKDLGGASIDQVVSFMLDVAAYSIRSDVNFQI